MQDQPKEDDIFEKYNTEFLADTKIDEMNIKEQAMTAISIKHKWVGRLMRHKRDLKKLEKAKKDATQKVVDSLTKGDVGLTMVAARKAASSNDLLQRIEDEIHKTELLVEYLEKVERILNSMTYDIKNIIDIQKMETM